jgi:hypothetical protein
VNYQHVKKNQSNGKQSSSIIVNNVGKPYFKLQIINEKEVRSGKRLAVSNKSRLMKTHLVTNVLLIWQL